jgi:hypothetical protein
MKPTETLPLFIQEQRDPTEESERDVLRTLSQFAATGQRWTTAVQIGILLGWGESENTRRKIRAIAEVNRHKILSGQRGYCLLEYATREEIQHAVNWFAAQRRAFEAAEIAYTNYLHKGEQ